MTFSDSKGLKAAIWSANEQLVSDDVNFLALKEYSNFTDIMGVIGSSIFEDPIDANTPNVILGGLRIAASTTQRRLTVEGGVAVSFKGNYDPDTFTFSPEVGKMYSCLLPSTATLDFDGNTTVNSRIDIVILTPAKRDYDTERRNFRDPISATITVADQETKTEYYAVLSKVNGTPASSPVAPSIPNGSIKIAEVTVASGAGILSDVRWVDDSANWTTDISDSIAFTRGISNPASMTERGIIRIATDSEASAGTLDDVAITPAQLMNNIPSVSVPNASITIRGIIRIAQETDTTSNDRAVTPAILESVRSTLNTRISNIAPINASTTRRGIIEIATNTETQTGTDSERAITPAGLSSRTATTTRRGIIQLASVDEARAGTVNNKAVTLSQWRRELELLEIVGIYQYRRLSPSMEGVERDAYNALHSVLNLNVNDFVVVVGSAFNTNISSQILSSLSIIQRISATEYRGFGIAGGTTIPTVGIAFRAQSTATLNTVGRIRAYVF